MTMGRSKPAWPVRAPLWMVPMPPEPNSLMTRYFPGSAMDPFGAMEGREYTAIIHALPRSGRRRRAHRRGSVGRNGDLGERPRDLAALRAAQGPQGRGRAGPTPSE